MYYMPSTPHETEMVNFWLLRRSIHTFRMVVSVSGRNACMQHGRDMYHCTNQSVVKDKTGFTRVRSAWLEGVCRAPTQSCHTGPSTKTVLTTLAWGLANKALK